MNKREIQQRKTNIKEIDNEVRILKNDLQKLTSNFEDNILIHKNLENISFKNIKALQAQIRLFAKSVREFFGWFKFWKEKDWYDKEKED